MTGGAERSLRLTRRRAGPSPGYARSHQSRKAVPTTVLAATERDCLSRASARTLRSRLRRVGRGKASAGDSPLLPFSGLGLREAPSTVGHRDRGMLRMTTNASHDHPWRQSCVIGGLPLLSPSSFFSVRLVMGPYPVELWLRTQAGRVTLCSPPSFPAQSRRPRPALLRDTIRST